jgi:hypothetical protein
VLKIKKMLWVYSFQIGMFEGKLLKRPVLDVGCCTVEEKEGMVLKMHVTVKRCSINDKTMGIL